MATTPVSPEGAEDLGGSRYKSTQTEPIVPDPRDRISPGTLQSVAPRDFSNMRSGAAFVQRRNRRRGMIQLYAHGSQKRQRTMPVGGVQNGSGTVDVSSFNRTNIPPIFNGTFNGALWQAGYPRNLGFSFRVEQLRTNTTGGPGPAQMNIRPRFNRVQTIRRYNATPKAYNTKPAR